MHRETSPKHLPRRRGNAEVVVSRSTLSCSYIITKPCSSSTSAPPHKCPACPELSANSIHSRLDLLVLASSRSSCELVCVNPAMLGMDHNPRLWDRDLLPLDPPMVFRAEFCTGRGGGCLRCRRMKRRKRGYTLGMQAQMSATSSWMLAQSVTLMPSTAQLVRVLSL
jgi:hypothetical protein